MIRLQVVVEGATEEGFFNQVLRDHLASVGVAVSAMKVLRGGGARGGGSSWQPWRDHLRGLLGQDRSADLRVTTMLDLYRIPKDAPGFAPEKHGIARAEAVLSGMKDELKDRRFIPYIQVHEFEALLFADLHALSRTNPDTFDPATLDKLALAVDGMRPEDIDDGYETAPSRRIGALFPAFDKVAHGPRAIAQVGLPALKNACPRFGAWLHQLEALATTGRA